MRIATHVRGHDFQQRADDGTRLQQEQADRPFLDHFLIDRPERGPGVGLATLLQQRMCQADARVGMNHRQAQSSMRLERFAIGVFRQVPVLLERGGLAARDPDRVFAVRVRAPRTTGGKSSPICVRNSLPFAQVCPAERD